jgi:hypothetical protein
MKWWTASNISVFSSTVRIGEPFNNISKLFPLPPFTQSQSLFCLDISPLIYLFVSSSSISPKFPLFNHKYIYWKRVNSYWYSGLA